MSIRVHSHGKSYVPDRSYTNNAVAPEMLLIYLGTRCNFQWDRSKSTYRDYHTLFSD